MEQNKPHHERRQKVYQLLDQAWKWGKTTQYQMQKFVEKHTGLKPSPKLIVKWKRSRQIPIYARIDSFTMQN
jgi:hypothetical protein